MVYYIPGQQLNLKLRTSVSCKEFEKTATKQPINSFPSDGNVLKQEKVSQDRLLLLPKTIGLRMGSFPPELPIVWSHMNSFPGGMATSFFRDLGRESNGLDRQQPELDMHQMLSLASFHHLQFSNVLLKLTGSTNNYK